MPYFAPALALQVNLQLERFQISGRGESYVMRGDSCKQKTLQGSKLGIDGHKQAALKGVRE
eukprot:2592892-Amphidinium_carterae.1